MLQKKLELVVIQFLTFAKVAHRQEVEHFPEPETVWRFQCVIAKPSRTMCNVFLDTRVIDLDHVLERHYEAIHEHNHALLLR